MKRYPLNMGGSEIEFQESTTQIAVRPNAGAEEEMNVELEALGKRHPTTRRGRLGAFEIVEISADTETVLKERGVLRHTAGIGEEVAVYHTSDDNVPFVPEGTIYVVFNPESSDELRQKIVDKFSLELVDSDPDGALTVRVSGGGEDAVVISAQLQKEDGVDVAEPDLTTPARLKSLALPTDKLLDRQWHLRNTGKHGGQSLCFKAGADARVIDAWEEIGNLGSSSVVVGIIDDGFDLDHPDLSGKSLHPWDFTRMTDDVSPVANKFNHHLGDWHGTACAGVATAKAGSGKVIGASPEARMIPVRWGPNLNPQGPRGVAKWFDHMTDMGAWVLSCSWGAAAKVYPLPSRTRNAIARCAKNGRSGKGTVILFAAGNSNHDVNDRPNSLDGFAIHPDVMAVAASNSRDQRSNYSNFGMEISVCAPSNGKGGWGIVTSDAAGTYTDANGNRRDMGYSAGDYTYDFGGTSSACPLAAGVAALVLSVNPELTASEVRSIMEQTARKIGKASDYDSKGHSIHFGYGCVDAKAAVSMAEAQLSGMAVSSLDDKSQTTKAT